MDEKTLQRKCIDKAKKLGILAHKVESRSTRGFPDAVFIFPNGTVVFIEFKHPNGKGRLSELQRRNLNALKRNNANAYCINSETEFREIVARFIDPAPTGGHD